jgi:hypothetical protein
MTLWILFILLGAGSAVVALVLSRPFFESGNRRAGRAALFGTPVLALGLFLIVGSPSLPGRPLGPDDLDTARARGAKLLGEKPFEILTKEDSSDIPSLMALGDLSRRLAHPVEAEQFYQQALDYAELKKDPFGVRIAEKLLRFQISLAGDKISDRAMRTADRLLTLDPTNAAGRNYRKKYNVQVLEGGQSRSDALR